MIWAIRLTPYLAVGALVWWVMDMRADLAASETTIDNLTLRLSACDARTTNILEDTQSDAEIDNLPDDGLRDVPDHWLLTPRTGSPAAN